MDETLKKELRQKMSLNRLAKTGLFQKLPYEHGGGDVSIARELKLHRAVLDKALIDMFAESKETRQDVSDWLYLDNPDFIEACERAFLKPEYVYKTFQTIKEILKGANAKLKKFHE